VLKKFIKYLGDNMGHSMGSTLGTVAGGAIGFMVGGPAGATAGAGIGGSIGGGIDASNAQDRAMNEARAMSEAQLAFNKQQYEDWKRIFGPIEQNLSSFYQQLSPESYSSALKNKLSHQFNIAEQQLDRTMAQRGIDDSGLAFEAHKDLNQELAKQKALADQTANDIVEQKKLGFLGLGLGNQNAINANINSSYANAANLYMNNANIASQQAAGANQGLGNILGATGYAYGRGMFNTPTAQTIQSPGGYNFNQWQLIK
jgi:hypothetical protein